MMYGVRVSKAMLEKQVEQLNSVCKEAQYSVRYENGKCYVVDGMENGITTHDRRGIVFDQVQTILRFMYSEDRVRAGMAG